MSFTFKMNYRHIPLEVIIDSQDFILFNSKPWKISLHTYHNTTKFYIRRYTRKPKKATIYFHREIMNAPKGKVVDHINGNTLDCRRVNLCITTQKYNATASRQNHRTAEQREIDEAFLAL